MIQTTIPSRHVQIYVPFQLHATGYIWTMHTSFAFIQIPLLSMGFPLRQVCIGWGLKWILHYPQKKGLHLFDTSHGSSFLTQREVFSSKVSLVLLNWNHLRSSQKYFGNRLFPPWLLQTVRFEETFQAQPQ